MKRQDLMARREELDRRIRSWRPGNNQPPHGWLREMRKALGMSSRQLAKRLKRSQPAVSLLERAEAKGTIRLGTLQKAAEAMGCKLYYLIAPARGQTLADVVRRRAKAVATLPAMLSLRKAGMDVSGELLHEFIDQRAKYVAPRELWNDPNLEQYLKDVIPAPPPPPVDTRTPEEIARDERTDKVIAEILQRARERGELK